MSDAKPNAGAIVCEALKKESPEGLSTYWNKPVAGTAKCGSEWSRCRGRRYGSQFLGGPLPSETATIDAPRLAKGRAARSVPTSSWSDWAKGRSASCTWRSSGSRCAARWREDPEAGMDTAQVIARFEAEQQALP